MKNAKREKQIKPTIAAILLAAFSFGPYAYAGLADKEGVSIAELNKIIPDFKIKQDGLNLRFTGSIPDRCAAGAEIQYTGAGDKHLLTVRMPNCEKDYKSNPEDTKTAVSEVFAPVHLQDASGKVLLRNFAAGDPSDEGRAHDEELKDEKNKSIVVVSSEEQERHRQEEADLAEKKRQEKDRADLAKRIGKLCRSGKITSLKEELENSGLLLEMPELLGKIEKMGIARFKKEFEKAKTIEETKAAYEAYVAEAEKQGWDENLLDKAYVEKRVELLKELVSSLKGGDATAREVVREIDGWKRDLRAMNNRKLYQENKREIGLLYADLFYNRESMKLKLEEAVNFAEKAKANLSSSDLIKLNQDIEQAYLAEFKACVEASPARAQSCEKKYVDKAKKYSDSVSSALQSAAKGNEEMQQEFGSYMQTKYQTYGAGQSMQYQGFGSVNQYPGAIQQYKYQQIMQYQQQQYMQYMQAMQQRMYGGYNGMNMNMMNMNPSMFMR